MKNKIITLLILLFAFVVIFLFFKNKSVYTPYKILQVKHADLFYIDLNNNNKIDSDELIKLKDISAFYPYKNEYCLIQSKNINISPDDYIKLGYLADYWAKNELENKIIYLDKKSIDYSKNNNYRYAYIKYNEQDLAKILLVNGLAYVKSNNLNYNYYSNYNYKQILNNINSISELNFIYLNNNTKVFHDLKCEHIDKIASGQLLLKKDLLNDSIPCKVCISEQIKRNEFNIPLSKKSYKKSVYKKFDNFEIYLINPLEYPKPNSSCVTDICKRIVNEINSCEKSIDIALYEIGFQPEIFAALDNAKKRGVLIKSVIDISRDTEKNYPQSIEFIKKYSSVTDSKNSLMHNKFFIFDDKKILTGSMNISPAGSGGYNSNIVIILEDENIAAMYKKEFLQMQYGKFSSKKQLLNSIESNNISVYFSPKNDIYENAILPEIKNAKKEIMISAFYLTHKKLIQELIEAKKRGIDVFIILDSLCAMSFKDNVKLLRNASIPLAVENWGGKNHEKTIVIDSSVLIVGSSNYSNSGFYKNDENILVIKNKNAASLYRDYFLYLFNSIDKKYLKLIPRAESIESVNSCSDGIDNNYDGKTDAADDGCKVPISNKK